MGFDLKAFTSTWWGFVRFDIDNPDGEVLWLIGGSPDQGTPHSVVEGGRDRIGGQFGHVS